MVVLMCLFMDKGIDYYFHIKTGEYIINNFSIPSNFLYSWYAISNNINLVVHEWLSTIFIYIYHVIFKNFGSLFYVLSISSILSFILYKFNSKVLLKKRLIYYIPFIILASINLGFYTSPRPHIISWILFVLTIYLCYDFYKSNNKKKKIYFLPVIAILWSNLQGGSSNFVYLIPILFLLIGLFNFDRFGLFNKKISKERSKKLLLIILLCIGGICLNPYGIKMLLVPYQYIINQDILRYIEEWQMLRINTQEGLLGYIFILYSLFIFFKTKSKLDLKDFMLYLIFTVASIVSYRFTPYLVLAMFLIIPKYLDDKVKTSNYLYLVLGIIIAIIGLLLIQSKNLYLSLNNKPIADGIINYLKTNEPKRLYNDYNIGGYLIYHEIPTFIDGRNNGYLDYNLQDYYDMTFNDNGNISELIEKYDFDMALVRNTYFIDHYFKFNKEYALVIKDNNYSLYRKID